MPEEKTRTTVVVAVDFDESGEAALREAFRMSQLIEGLELHAVHVLDTSKEKFGELSATLDSTMELLLSHVSTVAEAVGVVDHVAPVGHIRVGEPARAIHQLAVDVDADQIIVGTHARRGLERIVLGSVSDELIKRAHTPVMVARVKDYSTLRHSDSVQPPRPGQDMSAPSATRRLTLARVSRTSHMPGLL